MSGFRALEKVFPVTGWRRFLREYWPARPLHRKGRLERLRGLDDLSAPGGIVNLAVRSQMELKAMLPARSQEHNEIKIGPGDIIPLLDAGATIACNSIQRWHPAARRWTELLAHSLTGTTEFGACNAYMTPVGRGVPMHFDDHEIIVVQLAGKKTWTFAPNTQVVNPAANSGRILSAEVLPYAVGEILQEMPANRTRVSMSPGSVLFLPRGYWHETDAEELSISITFGFRTPCWAELIADYLRQKLLLDSGWREPAWDLHENGSDGAVEEQWQARLAELERIVRGIGVRDLLGRPHSARKRHQR